MNGLQKQFLFRFRKIFLSLFLIFCLTISISPPSDGSALNRAGINSRSTAEQEFWIIMERKPQENNSDRNANVTKAFLPWKQSFRRVGGNLELRVGDSKGRLISWPDRGSGGRFTWAGGDPAEQKDISPWVGNGNRIKLWARFTSATREPCLMDTYSGEVRKQRWEFIGVAEYEIQ